MSGILNSKTRVFDTIITDEGRRKLADGSFQICFVSFTDGATFYQSDAVSGSDDASRRIFFEAASKKHDQITVETDNDGIPIAFKGKNAKIVGTLITSGTVEQLLQTSIDNFRNLQLIKTADPFWQDDTFSSDILTGSFNITDKLPFEISEDATKISIDNAESFFQDRRLSHIPNFNFMSPVLAGTAEPIGNYVDTRERPIASYNDLTKKLRRLEKISISFFETSRESNLMTQIFETSTNLMEKLDVIDFGEFTTDEERATKQVYFVGKVYSDQTNMKTYANIFTIVFD